jgi:hypothetical protein
MRSSICNISANIDSEISHILSHGLNCQEISGGGVDICLFIVITHRQFNIINNGGGLKLTPPPRVSQGILFGGVKQTTGGSPPNTPRQFKH